MVVRAENGEDSGAGKSLMARADQLLEKLGISLGPIGMSLGASKDSESKDGAEARGAGGATESETNKSLLGKADEVFEKAGLSLGPIGRALTLLFPSAGYQLEPHCLIAAPMTSVKVLMLRRLGEEGYGKECKALPLGMSLGESASSVSSVSGRVIENGAGGEAAKSIAPLTTEEWQKKYVNVGVHEGCMRGVWRGV